MTSSDGFCSTLTFSPSELGEPYIPDSSTTKPGVSTQPSTSLSSQNTPIPTPTSAVCPPSPFPGLSRHRTPSNPPPSEHATQPASAAVSGRPASPTRTNSTSSIISTQSPFAPSAFGAPNASYSTGTVISNPPLVSGSVPGITAGSFVVPAVNMTTPPQTPRSAASSVSGAVAGGVKRDAGGVSEDESARDAAGARDGEGKKEVAGNSGPAPKKRKIAPTLIGELKR